MTNFNTKYNKKNPAQIYVIQLRQDNPEMTLLEIGNIVGVTKERVRQILKKAGMETRSAKAAHERQPPHLKFGKPCPTCNKPVQYRQWLNSKNTSPSHGYYPIYHIECRPGALFMDLVCPYCDKSFRLGMYDYNQKLKRLNKGIQKGIYCSHRCVIDTYWDSVHQRIANDAGYVMRTGRNTSSWTPFTCGICGTEKFIRTKEYDHRVSNSKTGILFCGRECLWVWIRKGE
tara:strand:+ start:114 stop:803 length:690 start_codon:yes stop_codon:yes gene_type:complete